ncbi:hypothetical protein [Stenotrophomonas sp. PD6]|uniref:hypothetical protein n=1 Tax=Stenotrophomonas sp. PD6 TaxID=3368612 RepID=UPI003BA1EB1A
MRRAVFLLPLLFAGCSCQPDPLAERTPAGAAPATSVAAEPARETPAPSAEAQSVPPSELSAVAPGAIDESATVHAYVFTLLGDDRAASDAYWTGGHTAPRADDAVLRTIPDLRSLRVKTSTPIARDDKKPSHLLEVPVSIRAMTGNGTLNFEGWYRLQPKPDGSGWEIHSASLQPTLD